MKALTSAEMREVDRLTTARFGISGMQLMESAGQSVAEELLEAYGRMTSEPPRRVCVLCGKGNNGGDGFVVARHLKEEAEQVETFLFAAPEEVTGDAARNLERWRSLGGAVQAIRTIEDWEKAWRAIACADVLVDAMLGTGLRGPAAGVIARAIEDINRWSQNATSARPAYIVAVDTPSGMASDAGGAAGPVLRAHLTVTFTAPKVGQLIAPEAACCGQLAVREIGSPEALIEEIGQGSLRWAGASEFAEMPWIRAADAHKGSYGHALVVAGSTGKSGAAILAGQAALRGGAGLVTIAAPALVQPVIASGQPEYMTIALEATDDGSLSHQAIRSGRFGEVLRGKTVVAMGPGLGTHADTQQLIRAIVSQSEVPVVLDADGLNAFAGQGNALAARKTPHLVVTPHPGEMARLLGVATADVQKDRLRAASEAAKRWNAVVLLKGFHTVLASPEGRVFVNTTGSPALAKGGSGDVLTGLLAALIAQFGAADLLRVAALGAYLHGLAAELLGRQSDPSGALASEVAHAIPFARRRLLEELRASA